MDNDIQSPRLASYLKKKHERLNKYASFRRRSVAYSLDSLLISVISSVIGIAFNKVMGVEQPKMDFLAEATRMEFDQYGNIIVPTQGDLMAKSVDVGLQYIHQYAGYNWPLMFINLFLVPFLYFSFCTASKYQASPGMRYCRIKVTDQYGVGLDLFHAMARTLCHFLTGLTLGIGFITMNWHPKKRALHDILTMTEVRNVPRNKNSSKDPSKGKKG